LPQKVTLGSDGGVYSADNLGDNGWTSKNQNLGFAQIWCISSNTYNSGIIVGGVEDQGIGHKDGTGLSWSNYSDCDGGLVLASPFKSNRYAGGRAACGTWHYSTDGANFPDASNYLYGSTISSWVASVVNHPSHPGVLYGVRCGKQEEHGGYYTPIHILTSTDYGVNYNGGSNFSFDNPYYLVAQNSLAISHSNPNMMSLNLGNNSEYWRVTNNLYSRLLKMVTTDDGQTWSHDLILTAGVTPGVPNRFITHVEIDPVHEDE